MKSRSAALALEQPQLIHGVLQKIAGDSAIRPLWRIDYHQDKYWLLVLSKEELCFSDLVKQIGSPNEEKPWETKGYSRLLDSISEGQKWHFRIKANPTHSQTNPNQMKTRGKVYAHVTIDQQKNWLMKQSVKHGFSLNENEFDVTHTTWLRFKKQGGMTVSIKATAFEGYLEITDKNLFKECLISGIGRGKAYGLGLITIMRDRSIPNG